MPKKTLQRFMPNTELLKNHKHLQFFGNLLHSPNLWHLNRRSASRAFAVGLFVAFMPIPAQMIAAAALAIMFSANLPISVGLVWLSNPFTIPAIFYVCLKMGALLMGTPSLEYEFKLTVEGLSHMFQAIGPTFILGCFVCGFIAAFIGYFSISHIWGFSVRRRFRKRRNPKTLDE